MGANSSPDGWRKMSNQKPDPPSSLLPESRSHESDARDRKSQSGFTRRSFLAQLSATGLAASTVPLLQTISAAQVETAPAPPAEAANGSPVDIVLNVNGREHRLKLEPRVTLLDSLREELNLFGTKKGCDHGQCGACTVHVNGRRINSCLTFAIMHQGDQITTVEGLAKDGELHPVQAAFLEHDGFQCGYCTSGQIMSAVALLKEPCGDKDDDVRECMSGNICRCGAYPNIVAAVQQARKRA
jgi:xanthine dehydrogenase YagT iron-sulfur-binding subunit